MTKFTWLIIEGGAWLDALVYHGDTESDCGFIVAHEKFPRSFSIEEQKTEARDFVVRYQQLPGVPVVDSVIVHSGPGPCGLVEFWEPSLRGAFQRAPDFRAAHNVAGIRTLVSNTGTAVCHFALFASEIYRRVPPRQPCLQVAP